MMEWRPIPHLPDYAISENGLVRRRTAARTRYAGHMPKGHMRGGYWAYNLVTPSGKRTLWAHRLVAVAFIGPAPSPSHVIAHWDGDKLNNHYSNLRWATVAENNRDTVRHGRAPCGDRNPRSKLTPAQVREARARYVGRYGEQSALAREYGVSPSTMRDVLRGAHWRHV
jgi:hypothetical protein